MEREREMKNDGKKFSITHIHNNPCHYEQFLASGSFKWNQKRRIKSLS